MAPRVGRHDCVIVDNDMSLRASFVAALNTRFPLTDNGELEWILGVKVTRDRPARRLVLSQALYVTDLLKRFSHVHENVSKSYTSPVDDKCTLAPEQSPALGSAEHEAMRAHHDDYMSLVGAYLWLSNVSRPETSRRPHTQIHRCTLPGTPADLLVLRLPGGV